MKLSSIEKLLYMELFIWCWKDGYLPSDEATLVKISGLRLKEFRSAWLNVQHQFFQENGVWKHNKVEEGRPRLENWREARREAGRKGGKARAENQAIAQAELQAKPKPPSSSSSSSYSSSYPPNPQPMDGEFEEIWQAYPAKGRTRRPMCEQYYATTIMGAEERAMELHREILEPLLPGGKWERSKLWGNGFISALADYLANKRWLEDPEPKGEWD